MAASFNLTAQLNLVGPSNIKQIAAGIRRDLGSAITGKVDFTINPRIATTANQLTGALQKLNSTLSQTTVNGQSAASAINSLNAALGNTKISQISKQTNDAAKAAETLGVSSRSAAKDVNAMGSELAEFGRQSGLAIRRFAAFSIVSAVIYKLNNAVSSAIDEFIAFDREVVRLQQVTGKSASELSGLTDQITKLSTSLGVSSDDLIKTSATLAQAGLSARDTERALKALALSVNAPSFDSLTNTTEGAIAAMRQFGIQAKDLDKVLGSINAVSAQFAVEAGDIITAIQRTGGVFASASKGVAQGADALNQFIAVFTQVRATTRESAETIATGLRTIFARIQRKDTIEALRAFGVELTDLEGKFVGPYEAIARLSAVLNQLDPRSLEVAKITEELGGFRQIGKVIPLIQQFAVAQDALRVAQEGQGSLAADNAKAQLSLAIQLQKTKEEFTALIREIGKNAALQSFLKITLTVTNAILSLARAGKSLFPILTLFAGFKAVSGISQFIGGFSRGVRTQKGKPEEGGGGGFFSSLGQGAGEALSGAKVEKQAASIDSNTSEIKTLSGQIGTLGGLITDFSSSMQQQLVELTANTAALTTNTASIDALTAAINSSGGKTFASGGIVRKFARGGVVPGSGSGDTVPAMLEPGEFVIRKKAVETIGADRLHKMNKYASGGIVKERLEDIGLGGNKRLSKEVSGIDLASTNIILEPINLQQSDFDKIFEIMQETEEKRLGDIEKYKGVGLEGGVNADRFFATRKSPRSEWSAGNAFQQFLIRNKKVEGAPTSSTFNTSSETFQDIIDEHYAPLDFKNGDAKFVKNINSITDQEILSKRIRDAFDKRTLKPDPTTKIESFELPDTSLYYPEQGIKEKFNAFIKSKGDWWTEDNLLHDRLGRELEKNPDFFLNTGGLVQKFMAGGVAETIEDFATQKGLSLQDAVLQKIKELDDIKGVKGLLGTSGNLSSLLQAGNIKAGKRMPEVIKVINQAIEAKRLADLKEQERLAGFTKVNIAGLLPTDYNKNFEYKLAGRDVLVRARGFGTKYLEAVAKMQQESAGIAANFAEDIQNIDIFGTQGPLVFDFDDTLVKGADILGPDGRPDIPKYYDPKAVSEALKGATLTRLGAKLKSLIEANPEFIKNTRILTARPQSTAGLLAGALNSLGLPYSASDITGVGTGPNANIAAAKAANLAEAERLIDDSLANIEAAGGKGYLYKEPKSKPELDALIGQGNIEGAIIEKALALLGAPLPPIDQLESNRSIDFPNGLGQIARYFPGIGPNDPTEVKRTIDSSSLEKAREEFTRYFKENATRFADGGSAEDTVPALLTPGEFVINKKAAAKIGSAQLNRLNKADKIQGFNRGGIVGSIGVQKFEDGGKPKAISDVPIVGFDVQAPTLLNKAMAKLTGKINVVSVSYDEALYALAAINTNTPQLASALKNYRDALYGNIPDDEVGKITDKIYAAYADLGDSLAASGMAHDDVVRKLEEFAPVVQAEADRLKKTSTYTAATPTPAASAPAPTAGGIDPGKIALLLDMAAKNLGMSSQQLAANIGKAQDEGFSPEKILQAFVKQSGFGSLNVSGQAATPDSKLFSDIAKSLVDVAKGVSSATKGEAASTVSAPSNLGDMITSGADLVDRLNSLGKDLKPDAITDFVSSIKQINDDAKAAAEEFQAKSQEVAKLQAQKDERIQKIRAVMASGDTGGGTFEERLGVARQMVGGEDPSAKLEEAKKAAEASKARMESAQTAKGTALQTAQAGGLPADLALAIDDFVANIATMDQAVAMAAEETRKAVAIETAAIEAEKKARLDAIKVIMESGRAGGGTRPEQFAQAKKMVDEGGETTQALLDAQAKRKEASTKAEEAKGKETTLRSERKDFAGPGGVEGAVKATDVVKEQRSKVAEEKSAARAQAQEMARAMEAAIKRGLLATGTRMAGETREQYKQRKKENIEAEVAKVKKPPEPADVPIMKALGSLAKNIQIKGNQLNASLADVNGNASKLGSAVKGVADTLSNGIMRMGQTLQQGNDAFVKSGLGKTFQSLSSFGGLMKGFVTTAGLSMAGEMAGGYNTTLGTSLNVASSTVSGATEIAAITSRLGPLGTAVGTAVGALKGFAEGLFNARKAAEEKADIEREDAKNIAAAAAEADFGAYLNSVEPDIKDFQSGLKNMSEVIRLEQEKIAKGRTATKDTYFGFGQENLEGKELRDWAAGRAAMNADSGGLSKNLLNNLIAKTGKTLSDIEKSMDPGTFASLTQSIADADATYKYEVEMAHRQQKTKEDFDKAVKQAKDAAVKRAVSEQDVAAANEQYRQSVIESRKRLETQGTMMLEKMIGNTPEENRNYAKNIKIAGDLIKGDATSLTQAADQAFNEEMKKSGDVQQAERAKANVIKESYDTGKELLAFGDENQATIDEKTGEKRYLVREQKAQLLESTLKAKGIDVNSGMAKAVLDSLKRPPAEVALQEKEIQKTEELITALAKNTDAVEGKGEPQFGVREGREVGRSERMGNQLMSGGSTALNFLAVNAGSILTGALAATTFRSNRKGASPDVDGGGAKPRKGRTWNPMTWFGGGDDSEAQAKAGENAEERKARKERLRRKQDGTAAPADTGTKPKRGGSWWWPFGGGGGEEQMDAGGKRAARPKAGTAAPTSAPRVKGGRGQNVAVAGGILATIGGAFAFGGGGAEAEAADIPANDEVLSLLEIIADNTACSCGVGEGMGVRVGAQMPANAAAQAETAAAEQQQTFTQSLMGEFTGADRQLAAATSIVTDALAIRGVMADRKPTTEAETTTKPKAVIPEAETPSTRPTRPASLAQAPETVAKPGVVRQGVDRLRTGAQTVTPYASTGLQLVGTAVSAAGVRNAYESGDYFGAGINSLYTAGGALNTAAGFGGGRYAGLAGDTLNAGANATRLLSGRSFQDQSMVQDTLSLGSDVVQIGAQLPPAAQAKVLEKAATAATRFLPQAAGATLPKAAMAIGSKLSPALALADVALGGYRGAIDTQGDAAYRNTFSNIGYGILTGDAHTGDSFTGNIARSFGGNIQKGGLADVQLKALESTGRGAMVGGMVAGPPGALVGAVVGASAEVAKNVDALGHELAAATGAEMETQRRTEETKTMKFAEDASGRTIKVQKSQQDFDYGLNIGESTQLKLYQERQNRIKEIEAASAKGEDLSRFTSILPGVQEGASNEDILAATERLRTTAEEDLQQAAVKGENENTWSFRTLTAEDAGVQKRLADYRKRLSGIPTEEAPIPAAQQAQAIAAPQGISGTVTEPSMFSKAAQYVGYVNPIAGAAMSMAGSYFGGQKQPTGFAGDRQTVSGNVLVAATQERQMLEQQAAQKAAEEAARAQSATQAQAGGGGVITNTPTPGQAVDLKMAGGAGNLAGLDIGAMSTALQGTLSGFVTSLGEVQLPKIPEIINMEGRHTVEVVITGAEAMKSMTETFQNMITEKINEAMKTINNKTEGGFGP